MTGTGDINYAQIMFLDDAVQMHVDEIPGVVPQCPTTSGFTCERVSAFRAKAGCRRDKFVQPTSSWPPSSRRSLDTPTTRLQQ
jgi:hypothetical protein